MNILSRSRSRAGGGHPFLAPKKERAIPPWPQGTGHHGAVLVIA